MRSIVIPLLFLAATLRAALTTQPAIIERVHQQIVPHTDKQGHILTKFDNDKSFFPIGLWGQVLPDAPGGPYPDWNEIADAGFNIIWPMNWDDRAIGLAEAAKIQLVYMGQINDERAGKLKDHPNLLGNMWVDEPTGKLNIPDFKMEPYFQEFLDYKKRINAAIPALPVFINDPPAIFPDPPKFRQWWLKWNTAGDISCQDVYPIVDRTIRTRTLAPEPTGIPQVVSLAVSSNEGKKPVWTILGAFDSPADPNWPFRMPTPRQLRAQIYTAIISGATGVHYFIMDSHASRRGGVVGMSPRPRAQYAPAEEAIATPVQLVQAKALWEMAKQINSELRELTPVILSPTAGDNEKFAAECSGDGFSSKQPLRCLLKRGPAGGYVLLTVNTDDAILNATFTFGEKLTTIEPLYENRPATPPRKDGISFTDRYEPFDVHLYRITPQPPASAPAPPGGE